MLQTTVSILRLHFSFPRPLSIVRGVLIGFFRRLGGTVPLRSATLLNCVPLDGSELDAKVETLSMERTLQECLHTD